MDSDRREDLERRLVAMEALIEELRLQHDDFATQLPILRQAFRAIDMRLRKLEGARPTAARNGVTVKPRPTPAPVVTSPVSSNPESSPQVESQPPAAGTAARAQASVMHATATMTMIHVEDQDGLRESVEVIARRWSVSYHHYRSGSPASGSGPRALVLNLLLQTDPLAEITSHQKWGIDQPAAFTYCSDGTHGVVLGMAHYFPPPFDVEACVQRLLARSPRPQRLLVIGESFDSMNALKDTLAQVNCGISMAFDTRQALDLVPMLKPDLALIDLNLPRGEALRVAARLRTTTVSQGLPLGFFWNVPLGPDEIREQAARAAREFSLSADDLTHAISRALTPDGLRW